MKHIFNNSMKFFIALVTTILFISCASNKNSSNFEKLVYNSSRCFGDCPIIHFQVTSDKTLLLSKMKISRMSAQAAGDYSIKKEEFKYYKGKVSDDLYNQMLAELVTTDSVNLEGPNCCDASMKTMIAYYNGKRKYVKTMFPSAEGKNLFSILQKISESENLTETSEKFEFETEERRD